MMETEWARKFDELKALITELVAENEALKAERDGYIQCHRETETALMAENRELRADRDYYRQLVDQTGGKG